MFEKLIRQDLRDFTAYTSARSIAYTGEIWLNANELPFDINKGLNRYPEPQPKALIMALADLYCIDHSELLITRGSNEGIDLLIRLFCTYQKDVVMAFKPTFGMYKVSARLQGVGYLEFELSMDRDFAINVQDLLSTVNAHSNIKLLFICSPNNPTGNMLSLPEIDQLCLSLQDKTMVVVDEAYIEFSENPSVCSLINKHDNLIVLRTLSKAHGLAGERLGAVLANRRLICFLRKILAPYPIARSTAEHGLLVLKSENLEKNRTYIAEIKLNKQRLFDYLKQSILVKKVYPSAGNFLLVFFKQDLFEKLINNGIVVRSMAQVFNDHRMLRITIGSAHEVSCLIQALKKIEQGEVDVTK